MSDAEINECFNEPEFFPEQFIPDHVFVYIVKGKLHCYDGNKKQDLLPGDYYLFRKNHLIKYYIENDANKLEFIRICIEEDFLKQFKLKHKITLTKFLSQDSLIKILTNKLIPDFIRSLHLIYHQGEINEPFTNVKQEELLLILLQDQPELAGMLFEFGKPAKINLEEFMNRNFTFNVSLQRFAFLTGRSLSAFKRDFQAIFNETPNRWLVNKRLQEAYFLIDKKNKKPSEIYLDLGFETLSHFSYAFKKRFKLTPTQLIAQRGL